MYFAFKKTTLQFVSGFHCHQMSYRYSALRNSTLRNSIQVKTWMFTLKGRENLNLKFNLNYIWTKLEGFEMFLPQNMTRIGLLLMRGRPPRHSRGVPGTPWWPRPRDWLWLRRILNSGFFEHGQHHRFGLDAIRPRIWKIKILHNKWEIV